jgi:diguanylate cyclase (GGDEF)-like protein
MARAPGESRQEDRRDRARALATLHFAGAVLTLVPVVLPHEPGLDEMPLLVLSLAAAITSGVLFVLGPRVTLPACHSVIAIDILATSLALFYAGFPAAVPYAAFYISLSVYAFHFFRRQHAIAHLALVGAAYATVLAVSSDDLSWLTGWLVTASTSGLAGWVVGSLSRKARDFARADALTSLANRIAWEEALVREVVRAERDQTSLCVALLDLDNFKECNDTGGHQAGDRMLQRAASAWIPALRRTDLLARYGGDEFALILPNCDLPGAEEAVERLRQVMPKGQTFSAGVARWDGGEPAAELVVRADHELYAAKHAGRNRTATAS